MGASTLIRIVAGAIFIMVLAQGVHAAGVQAAKVKPTQTPIQPLYSQVKTLTFDGLPWGIAVDASKGWLYIADHEASYINKFDLASGKVLQCWTPRVNWGLAVDNNGYVYTDGVNETGYDNIYILDPDDGSYFRNISTLTNLQETRGLAVDSDFNIFVAEWKTNTVKKFSSDGNLMDWRPVGAQFNGPEGVAIDSNKWVYITDHENHRIQRFNYTTGLFNSSWVLSGFSNRNGQFSGAEGIAVDASGNIYITDVSNSNAQKYDTEGLLLTYWGDFASPAAIDVDEYGNVYLADSTGIMVYAPSDLTVASFKGDPTSGVAPLTVAFTDASTNSPTSWAWTFGDGGTSTSKNPSHTYTTAGNYTVTLKVTNARGSNFLIRTNYITVNPTPPVAKLGVSLDSTDSTVPLTVTFNSDESTGSPPLSYTWDFGDETEISTEQNPVHTYTPAGTYTASLTVSGPGGSDTTTTVIDVQYVDQPGAVEIADPPVSGATTYVSEVYCDPCFEQDGDNPPTCFDGCGYLIMVDTCLQLSDDVCISADGDHPVYWTFVNIATAEKSEPFEASSLPHDTPLTYVAGDIPTAEGIDGNSVGSASQNPGRGIGFLDLIPQCDSSPDCSNNYALLIDGGKNATENHIRYWNDISFMYQTLNQTYGYPTDHITVLMSDGTDPAYDRHYANAANGAKLTDPSPLNLDLKYGTTDVNGAATNASIISTLTSLNTKLQSADSLFIFTTGHGGKVSGTNNAIYYTWNTSVKGEWITDTLFVSLLPQNAKNITMVMEQCNSGGFIDNFMNTRPANQNRVIITAANANEPSWGNGFSNAWTEAVARIDDARKPNFLADTDGNLKISMLEAYNYVLLYDPVAKPSLPVHEHPQYQSSPSSTVGQTQILSYCPPAADIIVTSPVAGEVWHEGYTRKITWVSSGLNSGQSVHIELWNRTPGVWRADIATVLASTKYYNWAIPKPLVNANLVTGLPADYWINITTTTSPIASGRSGTFVLKPYTGLGKVSVTSVLAPNTTQTGATIYLDGVLQVSKLTNRTGSYVLTGIAPGSHVISVTKTNYTEQSYPGVVPINGGTLIVPTFVLEPVSSNNPGEPGYQPPAGQIDVISKDPDGSFVQADILIGGAPSGVPANQGPVPIDPNAFYDITVQAEGYVTPPEQSIYIEENEKETLTFILIPLYKFDGFYSPVKMNELNLVSVNSPSATPLKWNLLDRIGNKVTNTASFINVSSYQVDCSDNTKMSAAIEEGYSGSSGLQKITHTQGKKIIFDYWQFNWQYNTSYQGTCRNIYINFDTGQTSPEVTFKFI